MIQRRSARLALGKNKQPASRTARDAKRTGSEYHCKNRRLTTFSNHVAGKMSNDQVEISMRPLSIH